MRYTCEVLQCDRCGKREMALEGDEETVFAEAKEDGWMFDETGDYCPKCAVWVRGKRSVTSQA